jgi:glycine cleavage system H lipoate-binding protein
MEKGIKQDKRDCRGYGSSYRRGSDQEVASTSEIPAVLGGQVWMVKPDKKAKPDSPCIWMAAGAVAYKSCNNFYECTACQFDSGMQKKVARNNQVSWQDAMRRRPALERTCRHSLAHRIEKRACAYDYECSTCDFDQFFEEVWTPKTMSVPSDMQEVKGFAVPMGYYFHAGHTWARIESGGYVRVGMDDFAHKLLGKADAFDLPLMGKELNRDRAGWGLKREEHLADVLSPLDGVIMEVNSEVGEHPGLANEKPYEHGWLFMVRTTSPKETVKKLMADADSLDWMVSEVNQLENMIEEAAGPLAADGGYLANDIFGNIPQLGWENLTKTFLRS